MMFQDQLNYWSTKIISSPILSRLAEKYLSIPCTYAPEERLFSVVGSIFHTRTATMIDEIFRNLIIVNIINEHSKHVKWKYLFKQELPQETDLSENIGARFINFVT
jgi:hypothetical protein